MRLYIRDNSATFPAVKSLLRNFKSLGLQGNRTESLDVCSTRNRIKQNRIGRMHTCDMRYPFSDLNLLNIKGENGGDGSIGYRGGGGGKKHEI